MAKENQQPNYENLITTWLLALILLPLVKAYNHHYSFEFSLDIVLT
jgi:hypothetical protein